jgi:hypothetical protein
MRSLGVSTPNFERSLMDVVDVECFERNDNACVNKAICALKNKSFHFL